MKFDCNAKGLLPEHIQSNKFDLIKKKELRISLEEKCILWGKNRH